MTDADPTSAELERQAEAARARLADTADELKARMSPGQIMDEVLNQFRGGDGTEMLANLKTQARDNPMALALIGSGMAWLMLGSGPQSGVQSGAHSALQSAGSGRAYPGYPGSSGPAGHADDRVGAARPMGEAGPSRADRAAQGAGAAYEAAYETVGGALHDAAQAGGEGLRDAAEGLRQTGAEAMDGLRRAGRDASGMVSDLMEREPLVLGALGFAVGAAIGAALPASELERRRLGAAGAALREKVEAGVETAREAAGEVYAAARDEADRQPGDAPLGERLGAMAKAAGDKVVEAAQSATADAGPSRTPPA